MTTSGAESGQPKDGRLDHRGAAGMLRDAQAVSLRANAGNNTHRQVLMRRWAPVALFLYVAAFLLLVTGDGQPAETNESINGFVHANVLLIPVLSGIFLVQGARNRLPVAEVRVISGRKLLLLVLIMMGLAALPAASLMGAEIPWWLCLLAAATIAVLGSLVSAVWARKDPVAATSPAVLPAQEPPDAKARWATAILGLYYGITGAVQVFSWLPLAALVLTLLLLVLMGLANTRWGISSVGSQWSKREWVAWGLSSTFVLALTLIVVKTSWNTPMIGIVGGAVIAAPLVFSALLPERRA